VKFSIRWKLVLAIGIPLLVVYAVMLVLMIGEMRRRAHGEMVERVHDVTSLYAAKAGSRFKGIARITEATAGTIGALPELPPGQLERLLRLNVEADGMIRGARVILDGSATTGSTALRVDRTLEGLRTGTPELGDRRDEDPGWAWLEGPRHTDGAGWTEPFFDAQDSDRPLIAYAAPIVRDGKLTGVVGVTIETYGLADHFVSIDVPGGGFTLLSPEGNLLVVYEDDRLGTIPNLFDLARDLDHPDYAEVGRRAVAGESGVAQMEGLLLQGRRWVAYAPVPSTPWSLIAVVPEDILLEFSRSQLQLGLAFLLAGLLIILLLIWWMATRITRPLARLASAVEHLGSGDLDARVSGVDTRDEIGDLAGAFNRMVTDLKVHVDALALETAAREAVESDLRVARGIQTSLLPKDFPDTGAFELHAINVSAKQVAGDFFDFFFLEDGTLVVIMADVSGKGVPAALYMAVARTVLRHVCGSQDSLGAAMTMANEILDENQLGSMYVTLFIGWYDTSSGALRYVNAGHPPPYRIDPSGKVVPFGEVTGTVLGLLPGREYTERHESLSPGDRLVFFTDGVPEAETADEEFYGDERFVQLLESCSGESVEQICERVTDAVSEFQSGRLQDDVTVMVLGRKPPLSGPV
jgi:sigma-B regulation protein RsbU (phosphoserine phosphatase)